MKKLFFIASVGLLFSCSNGAGTCVCTFTVTGSDVQTVYGVSTYIETHENYFEKDAQEYCDVSQNNANAYNVNTNAQWQLEGFDIYQSTSCELE